MANAHSRNLYIRNDPYEASDAVFGVKDSLLVDLQIVTDIEVATKYGVKPSTKFISYDFVLV